MHNSSIRAPLKKLYEMLKLCDTTFWDASKSWDTQNPSLSPCFRDTILTWIPTVFFFIITLPQEIISIKRNRDESICKIGYNTYNVTRLILCFVLIVIKFLESLSHIYFLIANNYYTSQEELFRKYNLVVLAPLIKPILQLLPYLILFNIYIKHQKVGRHTSGPIWLFYFTSLVTNFPDYYATIVDQRTDFMYTFDFYIECVYYPTLIGIFLLECHGDTQAKQELASTSSGTSEEDLREESPEKSASFLSELSIWWFNKFLYKGYKSQLTIGTLWQTLPRDKSKRLASIFDNKWSFEPKASLGLQKSQTYTSFDGSLKKKKSLVWLLFKIFIWRLLGASGLKLLHDCLVYTTPIIFKSLLRYMRNKDEPRWHGILFAVGLILVPSIQSFLAAHYFVRVQIIGLHIKTMISRAIYKKSLILSKNSRFQSTTGEIINLMAVDGPRLQDTMLYMNMIWSSPFQICIAISLLYRELGWSVFAGTATMILLMPINGFITKRMKMMQLKLMKTKDERIKHIGEILNGIKVIKLYAWENSFMAKILNFRSKELALLKKISVCDSLQMFIWSCSPFLVALTTFTTYLLSDSSHVLTPEKAFVSIYLFNLLRFPLSMLPNLITSLVMSSVSIKRLNKFLNSDELVYYVTHEQSDNAVTVENGTVSWQSSSNIINPTKNTTRAQGRTEVYNEISMISNEQVATLRNLNLRIKQGSFVAIVGRVASGKSSLLAALLGEMERVSGKFNISKNSKVAYVPQQAWIQNMSVKNNVIFGSNYDEQRYKKTVNACALDTDFETFPSGDMSEVGESGLNLSGGQKQRLSLARAVYSDSDIYLMDDPLSALDSHIAKRVYELILSSSTGMLSKKTRILATNTLFVLPHVDHIIVLKDGRIVEEGSFDELTKNESSKLAETLREFAEQQQNIERQKKEHSLHQQIVIDDSSIQKQVTTSDTSALAKDDNNITDVKTKSTAGNLTEVEKLETGSVNYKIYIEYFKAVTWKWVLVVLFFMISGVVFSVSTNVWLSKWSSESENLPIDQENAYSNNSHLYIYAALGSMQCLCSLLGVLSLYSGAVRGAKRLHHWLLTGIMHSATTTFFDITPTGRIINRFSKDIDTIDWILPVTFRSLMDCFLSVICAILVVCCSFPLFLLVIIPMAIVYAVIQRIFIITTRQLKRLESITRSPIYSNFGETLSGISVIRAFECEERFLDKSDSLLDTNNACAYPNIVANRWLSIRLELFGNIISFLVALFSVFYKGSVPASVVGLALSYSLGITQTLGWLVRQSSDLETHVVSVERVIEYINNKSEDKWQKDDFKPQPNWPDKGTVKFENYSTRYRQETSLVLRDINLDVGSCEKVGIVGRTGCGKTSLSLALFRILEPASGKIIIDNQDISECGLHDLRSNLTIIPQDAVLFSGSLRFNLDPLDLYTDDQIWRSLELSHLKPFVIKLNDRLGFKVSEYGDNLSHGQRQLVCLARAILRNSKIIVLDEATAAMDMETDELIQTTIKKEFKSSTIFTIAHRLQTIFNSDKILVMDSGRIAELDSPVNLLRNRSSVFASMVTAAGLNIEKILKTSELAISKEETSSDVINEGNSAH